MKRKRRMKELRTEDRSEVSLLSDKFQNLIEDQSRSLSSHPPAFAFASHLREGGQVP
jgi:hypothetical protein